MPAGSGLFDSIGDGYRPNCKLSREVHLRSKEILKCFVFVAFTHLQEHKEDEKVKLTFATVQALSHCHVFHNHSLWRPWTVQ